MSTPLRAFMLYLCFFPFSGFLSANGDISFRLIRNLIVVQATVDGVAGNFILDTGTRKTILDSRFFRGARTSNRYTGIHAESNAVGVKSCSIELGSHRWKNIRADLVQIEHLENYCGIVIHGLIGTELLRGFFLHLEFTALKLALVPSRKGETAILQPPDGKMITTRLWFKSGTPVVRIAFPDGSKAFVTLDTGATINLLTQSCRRKVLSRGTTANEVALGGVSTIINKVRVHNIDGISLEGHPLQPMRTIFRDLGSYNQANPGPVIQGIFGIEFLKQYRVVIDFRNHLLYLLPADSVGQLVQRK